MTLMIEPKHKTIKVRYRTYHELKKLAAEKPESLAALIERLMQAEQRAADLQARLDVATEDNAGLLIILRTLDYFDGGARAQQVLDKVQEQEHPGRAVMAQLTRELYAAQKALEEIRGRPKASRGRLMEEIFAEYDEACQRTNA